MTKRILQLDVLRSVAIFLVLGRHMNDGPMRVGSLHPIKAWVVECGWIGVDLFFVLSGFLVSGLLIREYQDTGKIAFKRFLIRRGLKIYPAYYFLIFAGIAFSLVSSNQINGRAFLAELFFLQNYGPSNWVHTWSIAVEEHFYLLLCLLFFILLSITGTLRKFPKVVCLVLIACLAMRIAQFSTEAYSHETFLFRTHLRLDALCFGALLSYFHHITPGSLSLIQNSPRISFLVGTILLTPALFLPLGNAFLVTGGLTLLYMGFGIILIAFLQIPIGSSFLIRSLSMVGFYSYSIYLWHVFVFRVVLSPFRQFLGLEFRETGTDILYFTLCISIGIFMSKLIEMPFLNWRNRTFPSHFENQETSPCVGLIHSTLLEPSPQLAPPPVIPVRNMTHL